MADQHDFILLFHVHSVLDSLAFFPCSLFDLLLLHSFQFLLHNITWHLLIQFVGVAHEVEILSQGLLSLKNPGLALFVRVKIFCIDL